MAIANVCQICNEVKEDLKNVYEKIDLGSADDGNCTENEINPIILIRKLFKFKNFVEKFYPDEDKVFKGICSDCTHELITSYKFYMKIKNMQLRLNKNKLNLSLQYLRLTHYKKILPKALESSTDKDCTSNVKNNKQLSNMSENGLNFCKYCNTNFESKESLEEHINNDHVDKQYFCRKCSQKFNSKAKFIKHFEMDQCKKARNYCFSCNYKEFEYKKELKKHLKLVHGVNINSSSLGEFRNDKKNRILELALENAGIFPNCDEEFPLNSDEQIMDIEFLDDFFLSQDENSTQFNDCWEALGLNLMNLENELEDLSIFTSECNNKSAELIYKCPKCQQQFTNLPNLFLHLAHIHQEFVLVCSGCGCKFNRVDEYVNHKANHVKENLTDPNHTNISDGDSKNNLQCSKCKKSFKKKFNFLIHLCKNDTNIKVQCNFCTTIFPNYKKMHEHQKLVHSKSFQCTLCDEKQFTTLAGLKYHLKSHDGVKEFECPYCKKEFLASTNLNAHIKTVHANFKFHVCKLCDQRFATLGHLKKHVGSVHQKERNYLCSICNKGFAQSSHLKQHMEIHTGQRKYPCNYCSKGFSRKIDLKRHEKKHYEVQCNELKPKVEWT